ncbi:MAG: hypothetical protein M0R03_13140 [Novosphingobium sp.]|nr:hypothetical protein [Novosphingobium sp.]
MSKIKNILNDGFYDVFGELINQNFIDIYITKCMNQLKGIKEQTSSQEIPITSYPIAKYELLQNKKGLYVKTVPVNYNPCFVVAGGPSLKNFNFDLLKHKTTFVSNKSIFDVPNTNYFVTTDYTFLSYLKKNNLYNKWRSNKAEKYFVANCISDTIQNINGQITDTKYNLTYDLQDFDKIVICKSAKNVGFDFDNFNSGYNSGFCFDDKTQILTKRGWKYFKNLKHNDTVLSLDPKTQIADYYPISDIQCFDYSGDLYCKSVSRGHQTDFAVTPDHSMFVYSRDRKKYEFKPAKFFNDHPKNDHYTLKTDFKWVGKHADYIKINGKQYTGWGNYKKIQYKIKSEIFMQFLGWYLSDGNNYCGINSWGETYRITIYQSKKSKHLDEIRSILSQLPFKYVESENKNMLSFRITNNVLGKYIKKHCGGSGVSKKIPNYLKFLTPDLIHLFLMAYMNGDGTKVKTGYTVSTISKKIGYGMLELFLKAGYKRVNCTRVKNKKHRVFPGGFKANLKKHNYVVHATNNTTEERLIFNPDTISYSGKVYDVTVEPHHTIFVKRNGMPFWSGNCSFQMALIMGYNPIYLLGFDMNCDQKDTHYHDGYGKSKEKMDQNLLNYSTHFKHILQKLRIDRPNLQIISCSKTSILNKIIDYKDIKDVL